MSLLFASSFLFHAVVATSDLPDTGTKFTRFPSRLIVGHDDGGLFAEGADSVEACKRLCINDRGCTSFEFGVSERTKGHCILSYDTRSTIKTATEFVASADFDYYERSEPLPTALASFDRSWSQWLEGRATGGVIVGITANACAQQCLHSAHCKSASFGTDSCMDAEGGHTGFTKNSDKSPMTCDQIKLFCQRGFGGKHADEVQKKCPLSCSQVFGYCYEEPACSNNGCKSRCRDANGIHFTVDGERLTCAAAAEKGLCLGEDDLAAASVRMKCPVSCRAAFDKVNTTHTAKSDFCPAPIGECLLSFSALGDDMNDVIAENIGDAAVAEHHSGLDDDDRRMWLSYRPGWSYFGKKTGLNGARCSSGTASRTGSVRDGGLGCDPCPAGTYSAISRTKCIACPDGYTSEENSGDMHSCTSVAAGDGDGASSDLASAAPPAPEAAYFNPGEVWAGTYTCDSEHASVTDDHGRFEIRVVAEGKMIQTFQNRWASGSYHMSYTSRPTRHASFEVQAGDWINEPSKRTLVQTGVATELESATRHHLTGNISESSAGNVMFHGDMCNGNGQFTLTRTCSVGTNPTFVAGEHWVGSYECFEHQHQDRFDIRRLDLVISDVTDTHVKTVSQFSHNDGAGSFRQVGAFDQASHRLHLIADGPSAWIKRPSATWYTSDLDGFVTDDALTFQGSKNNEPICGCIGECTLGYFTGAKSMWRCPTSDQCPNADRIVDAAGIVGGWTVGCGPNPQTCSKFSVHRVCTPLRKGTAATASDACVCNGQTDTAGRGGQCEAASADDVSSIYASRGLWCHVDPSCVIAGPGEDSSAAGIAAEGGTAKSGLWWARCAPETSTTTSPSSPCTETYSPWEWGECVPSDNCTETEPIGAVTGTRMPSTFKCGSTQLFTKSRPCVPDGCTIELDDSTLLLLSTTTQPMNTVTTSAKTLTTTTSSASTTTPSMTTSTHMKPAATRTQVTTETHETPAATTNATTLSTTPSAASSITTVVPQSSTTGTAISPAIASAGIPKPVELGTKVVEGSPPGDCNLDCQNGGICVLVRDSEKCNDVTARYYKPMCLCPFSNSETPSCFWGDRCEASTECPGDSTRSCNPQQTAGKSELWKAHPTGICSAEAVPAACFDASAALFNGFSGNSHANNPARDTSADRAASEINASEATASIALTALVVCVVALLVGAIAFCVLWSKYKNREDEVAPQSYINPMYDERSGRNSTRRRRRVSSSTSVVLGIEGPRAQLAMALADAEAEYQRDMHLVEEADDRTRANPTYASSSAGNLYATVEPLLDTGDRVMVDASGLPPYSEGHPSQGLTKAPAKSVMRY